MSFALQPRFSLEAWQQDAVASWLSSKGPQGPRHGIFDIFTGAGKTVLAAQAMSLVIAEQPTCRFAIVAPTIALAKQWTTDLPVLTNIRKELIGMVGGGRDDRFQNHQVIVFVLASARGTQQGKSRLASVCEGYLTMLVVDECHKAGATTSKKIFDVEAMCKLGLSATPERTGQDVINEDGLPIPLDQQPHGRHLGPVCYKLSLKDGIRQGLLPRFQVHHHGIELSDSENATYAALTSNIQDAANQLVHAGGQVGMYLWHIQTGRPSKQVATAALKLQVALLARKQFLYTASERLRVARQLVIHAWRRGSPEGAILFNERITDANVEEEQTTDEEIQRFGAERLFKELRNTCQPHGPLPFGTSCVALEHSGLPAHVRDNAVQGLRDGAVKVLCTVKALQEGINVPDVAMGISVASTASARQRIQTMGRILRPKRDQHGRRIPPEKAPIKMLHLLYVKNTADEEIYRKRDWNQETGDDRNYWWHWEHDSNEPFEDVPLVPKIVDEEEAWPRIAQLPLPQKWDGPGMGFGLTYRQEMISPQSNHDVTVHNASEILPCLQYAQNIGCIKDARGRFTVTPTLNVILKRGPSDENPNEQVLWAIGRLDERPKLRPKPPVAASPQPAELAPPSRPNKGISQPPRMREPTELADGPRQSDEWFVLLEWACLGAIEADAEVIQAAAELLQKRGTKDPVIAAKLAVAYLSHQEVPPVLADHPPDTRIDLYPQYVAAAFVHSRNDLIHRARQVWAPTTKGEKPQRKAMLRSMQILLGETNHIYRPTQTPASS